MQALFGLYLIVTFLYGLFGSFAWMLGMTTVSLFGIWAWFLVPYAVIWLISVGRRIDKSASRYDYFD